ncbi:TrbI/VirB10 family protein [uncultured Ruegeria sp.]|uniref:TrbI/VirB10 family protein n=1 Tax=uncultured Ruegeria sp. TaxID=259304 RepID=UPI00262AE137|nr:TrbI/VirB10 family protein [uncultured Ruegeria sp.]
MNPTALSLALVTLASSALAQEQNYQPINSGSQPVIFQPYSPAPQPVQVQPENTRLPEEQRGYQENPNTTWQNNLVEEYPPIVGASIIDDPSRTLTQGTVLTAVFGGAVSSELPGSVVATITRGVYSMDGTRLLLPRGSKLYGEYRADTKLAQTRIAVVWSRVITPDGLSAQIGSAGTDGQGRSGATGRVDTHFGERFGTAALLSIIGIAPVALVADNDSSNSVQTDLATQVGSNLQNATAAALEDYLRITPTIYVDQGSRINAILQRDVVFDNF